MTDHSALNSKVELPEENPFLGIIICKDKKQIMVECTLQDFQLGKHYFQKNDNTFKLIQSNYETPGYKQI